MSSTEYGNIFRDDIEEHLKGTCFAATASEEVDSSYADFLVILARPPAYTVVRVNTLHYSRQDVKQQLQKILQKKYEIKKQPTPIIEDHPLLADTLVIPSSTNHDGTQNSGVSPVPNEVIVDRLCAVAVLRGADIFAPGVMGAPPGMHVGETISVYGDVNGLCRRGYVQHFNEDKLFVGNGRALMSRAQLFVETGNPTRQDNTYRHSYGEHQYMLVALDKSSGKVKRIQENVDRLNLDMVRAYAFDSVKACQKGADLNTDTWSPPYPPTTFDKILLDAPCSGLGQRPQIKNDLKMKDLRSYPPYQRKLFCTAVELLKPGGTLVYSTCTITMEENEGLVEWALNTFPQLQLAEQTPHLGGPGRPFPGTTLTSAHLRLLQRFDPAMTPASHQLDCNVDTIGFFIAKFIKTEHR